jgi:hypothetical protein
MGEGLLVCFGLGRPPVEPPLEVECDPGERKQHRHLNQRPDRRRERLIAVCAKDGNADGDRSFKVVAGPGEGLGDGHLVAVLCSAAGPERQTPEEDEDACVQKQEES